MKSILPHDEVFILEYHTALTPSEMALRLGIKVSTVRQFMKRAKLPILRNDGTFYRNFESPRAKGMFDVNQYGDWILGIKNVRHV